jgi:PTH1 family peptidyl-tRNA hydrolase
MGLFQKKELPQVEVPYTVGIGDTKTRLIVGLGNIGAQYDKTRHNVGFACIDAFAAAEQGTWSEKKALRSLLCDLRIGSTRVLLCKPMTFMNLSGEAVRLVQDYFKLSNQQTVVVHDELDLTFGQIRTRVQGSAAGNNGIKSLIQHIGDDFGRIRVGIRNEHAARVDAADYVLQRFTAGEEAAMKALFAEVNAILNEYVFGGALPTDTRQFLI